MIFGTALILLFIYLFWFLSKILKFLIVSPVYLYLIFNTLVLFFSLLYFYFYGDKFSIANVDEISEDKFWTVYNLFIISDIMFLIGVLFYHYISTPKIKKLYKVNINDKLFGQIIEQDRIIVLTASFLTILVVLFYILTYSESLWDRVEYIPKGMNKYLITGAKILSLIIAIILGVVSKKNKGTSSFLMLIIFLLTFSTGSRTTFLVLIIYFLISYISSSNSLKNSFRFFAQATFSFLVLSYILSFRSSIETYGLKPYLTAIFTGESEVVNSFIFNIYYSFVFGVFATAKTMSEYTTDWNHLYVSLSPLPGGLVGWPELAKQLLITKWMPYTLHGQVFEAGTLFSATFFTIVGSFFAYFEKIVRQNLIFNKRSIAFVITLMSFLFIVYSFEYHLRSALRYLYYAFFILLFFWFLKGIKQSIITIIRDKRNNDN